MKKVILNTEIQAVIDSLSLDEKIGQLLCYNIKPTDTIESLNELLKKTHAGSIFIDGITKEQVQEYKGVAQSHSKLPVIVAADMENGPGCSLKDMPKMPLPMAWGACDDEELIEKAAECTGKLAREYGVQWTFGPLVDINYNKDNPIVNARGISDKPEQVLKMALAYMRGCETDGNLLTSIKHFPGDGCDDRNQHFCTTVNPMSKTQYMKTFGKIYKTMIKNGCSSIMVAHIALPCIDGEGDELGAIPATLSKKLKIDLLKNEWGFDGVIVSDAMSMIGSCARCDLEELAVEFIRTGSDVVLFPEKNDFERLKQAVIDGRITNERLNDALARIILMKKRAGLFEIKESSFIDVEDEKQKLSKLSQEIADKSIKVVRNYDNVIPLNKNEIKRALIVNIHSSLKTGRPITDAVEKQLNSYGVETETLFNPKHTVIEEKIKNFDTVIVCSYYGGNVPQGVHGGSNRTGWDSIMAFWRGYILKADNFIFISCGDPYKIYEFPYLKTYVNTFSNTEDSLVSAVKLIMGDIEEKAKNPVELKGFFNREV